MMNEQMASAIRSLLKVAGGALVTKGITDNSTVEMIVAGVVALVGVVWSYFHHAAPTTPPPTTTP